MEGVMVFIFANTNSLGVAIFIMVIFSSFVQAAEGSTYGIVPYVNPPCTGSISGIVGAGGNVGAVCFGLGFRQLETKQAFVLMASCIVVSGVISAFVCIKGHAGLFTGQDSDEVIAAYKGQKTATTLQVPEQDAEAAEAVEE
jgi:NNP family nitrate/nitrite transporter-like MFS transporter